MTPEQARAALVFLSRAQLTGVEAVSFLEVCRAVEAVANPPPAPPETPEPTP